MEQMNQVLDERTAELGDTIAQRDELLVDVQNLEGKLLFTQEKLSA